jgi:hypothetical protein
VPFTDRSVLPAGHPLARAMESFRCTVRQWADVAAILAGSLLAGVQGARWAGPLAGSAAAVLAVLSVVLAARMQNRRDRAVDVILDGREDLPIALVQRERRRLLSTRTRARLARGLQEAVGGAVKPPRSLRSLPPLCAPRVVSPLVDELLEISMLLHTAEVPARGVARVERLLTRASTSPLYAQEISALHEELCQVRELLTQHEA